MSNITLHYNRSYIKEQLNILEKLDKTKLTENELKLYDGLVNMLSDMENNQTLIKTEAYSVSVICCEECNKEIVCCANPGCSNNIQDMDTIYHSNETGNHYCCKECAAKNGEE